MRVSLLVIAALLMTATVATAQHQHSAPVEISGSEHPELIPDSTAYLNFFTLRSLPANATEEDRKHYDRKLAMLGLEPQDDLAFRLEMSKYRSKYDSLIASYNKKAEKGLATPPILYAELDKLVSETRGNLKNTLSPNAQMRFELAVQFMRRNTRTITTGGGQ